MEYDEFQRLVGKAGLKLKEFAELVRMQPASISNLAKREAVPSHLAIIAVLMGEMAEARLDFRQPLSRLDIVPKKSRGGGGLNGRFSHVEPQGVPRKKRPAKRVDLEKVEQTKKPIKKAGTSGVIRGKLGPAK